MPPPSPPPPPPPATWPPDGPAGEPLEPLSPAWSPASSPPPPPAPPAGPLPSVPHNHGPADRASLAVAALVLVLFCGAIGFAIGRASAPKNGSSAPAYPSFSPYTSRTIPRYTYPSYTYPSYTTAPATRQNYGEDPSGNTFTQPGVFTITFPAHHTYATPTSVSALGAYTRGYVVQSAGTESPRGLYVEWTDPLDITVTSQVAAAMCRNSYSVAIGAGAATIGGRAGYTCRIVYSSAAQQQYVDYAYLFANKRIFIFEESEISGATYAQFLAFVASFRLS